MWLFAYLLGDLLCEYASDIDITLTFVIIYLYSLARGRYVLYRYILERSIR